MNDKSLESRYQTALRKIGIATLMSLPEDVKETLKNTTDLQTKVRLLEMIAKGIRTMRKHGRQ